jgi:hypothetical protein
VVLTTTMWRCRGCHRAARPGSVMPVGLAVSVGLAVPVRAAVREQSASPFG